MAEYLMSPVTRRWLMEWPGPSSSKEQLLLWLDSTPRNYQVIGPDQEWARYQDGTWQVDEYRSSRSPTRVGNFTSEGLFDHWRHKGLGLACLRPSMATKELHAVLQAVGDRPIRVTEWMTPRADGDPPFIVKE